MKQRENSDYIRIFHTYIYKHVAYAILVIIFVVPVLMFHEEVISIYEMLTNQQKEWKEFTYNDQALLQYEGRVRLVNEKKELLYKGFFADGKCNGEGIIYEDGNKLYEGILVNNQMEDVNGKLFHKNGTTAYIGEIHNNMKAGMGTKYRSDGSLEYKGMFVNDRYEGEGMAYDDDGNIRYEGNFLDGVYHGKGILYEEGMSVLKVYEGDFAFGKANGMGILYDTWGKAYYEGLVSDGHINYTAYYGESLKVVKEHFLYPLKWYVYDETIAIVIPKLKLMLIPKQQLEIDTETWTLKEQKEDEIIIDKIALIDDDVDEPGVVLEKETIIKSWNSYGTCVDQAAWIHKEDIIAASISDSDLFDRMQGHVQEHDDVYEITIVKQPVISYVLSCPYDEMQITYRSFFPLNKVLYSMLEKSTIKEISK